MSEKQSTEQTTAETTKKVSRRAFARTSVVAGTAVVALPKTLIGETPAEKMAATRRTRDGQPSVGRLSASEYPAEWREGTTIAAKYYTDEEHYLFDERLIADNLWLFVDHESRIPDTGDYFVFEFGRGESVIILRDKAGEVKGYYNVCRHRGSRLCRHDADQIPADQRLSVRQLGQTGNTLVFRCPYHAWTYDLDGKLVYAYGMQEDFDPADNGLNPCHLQLAEGHIFVNLSSEAEPPDFELAIARFRRTVGQKYGTAELKVGARQYYPIHANWKLAIENFLECYHCGPAHRSLVTTHDWDYALSEEQKAKLAPELDRWVPPEVRPGRGGGGMGSSSSDRIVGRGFLNPGFVTGSLDGEPVAPLLPEFKAYTHGFRETQTGWSTAYWAAYDDHVAVARFTPRDTEFTDCEILWLVHPDAREGKDYDREGLMGLWHVTIQEDIWIVENNHNGVRSGAYGPGRYATHEVGSGLPHGFIKWYMSAVAGDIQPVEATW